jgi:hypothetical protein
MARRKFTAVIYRFSEPLADSSFGVVILDRDKTWKPTKKDNARIDALCEGACDMVDKDVLPLGGIGVAIDGEASDADFEKIDTDAFIAMGTRADDT